MRGHGRLIAILTLAVFMLGVFLLSNSFAADNKIAYVDLAVVFDGYNKTKDFDAKLEEAQKAEQVKIDKKVEAIKAIQDKLPLLSDEEKKKKEAEIDGMAKELQEYQSKAEASLRKDRDEKLKEVLKDIQAVVEKMAKDKGYDLILNGRTLLYGNNAMDITEGIVKILNGNYKKS
ncbi:MAG: OmpH family outer membrane protein [Candidatus Omnitrophica bacterium]|nr:OmpH family outer membrane protein [Candidatus Omnitrophota bacterium]MDD5352863.1 OmpH family outer membrane protein [Candidatus Omnitrophota bacterium]MDD5550462.1 OmpH family outer membrane protein [Candidatus Omnitrophota bacterium]